jgi:chromosome segregation ATPase
MSQKDLNRELRTTIKDLTEEKDELSDKLKKKESRIKQILIQLEQATDDVTHCGKKIREQEEEIKDLKAENTELQKKLNPAEQDDTEKETEKVAEEN